MCDNRCSFWRPAPSRCKTTILGQNPISHRSPPVTNHPKSSSSTTKNQHKPKLSANFLQQKLKKLQSPTGPHPLEIMEKSQNYLLIFFRTILTKNQFPPNYLLISSEQFRLKTNFLTTHHL